MKQRANCSGKCKDGTDCPYRAQIGKLTCGHHDPVAIAKRAEDRKKKSTQPRLVTRPVPPPPAAKLPVITVATAQQAENRVRAVVRTGASRDRFVARVVLEGKVWVCNVTGSSKDKANWKEFYERYAQIKTPDTCRIKDCQRKVGATGHMYIREDADGVLYNYLIPICSHHNSDKGLDYDRVDPRRTKWQEVKTQRGATIAVKIRENPATTMTTT